MRLTIPLVVAALTFALHLQMNMDLLIAAMIALLAGTSLALLHVSHQRGAIIRDLRRDLLRAAGPANAAMRNAQALPMGEIMRQMPMGPGPHAAPYGANVAPGPALSVPAPPPQHPQAQPAPQPRALGPVAGEPSSLPAASVQAGPAVERMRPEASAPYAAEPAAPRPSIDGERNDVSPRRESSRALPSPQTSIDIRQAADQVGLPPPLPPMPASIHTSAADRSERPALRPEPRAIAPAGTPALGGPVPPIESLVAPPAIDRIASAAGQHQPGASAGDRTMASYWALRPGVPADPVTAPLREPADRGGGRANAHGTSTGHPVQEQASKPLAETYAPSIGQVPPSAAKAAAEPELEAMQQLIQQLATQLNGPRAEQPVATPTISAQAAQTRPEADPALPPTVAESVATSVAALRATADTMRVAADSAPAPKFAPPSPVPLPEPVRETAIAEPTARSGPDGPVPSPRAASPAQAGARQGRYHRLAQASAAVAEERIDVLLEPIMGLGDRKARHFEVSVRLRDESGAPIDADDLADIAAGSGIMPKLDAAKIVRTARVASRLQSRSTGASLFSRLAGESLADQTFLDIFDDVFAGEPALLNRLVLSFAQSEVRRFSDGHWDAIEMMGDMGLRLSLEDVTDLDMDFESLREHGFDFVKLDAQVFLEGLEAPEGLLPAPEICRHFANMGLALIVGHIEDETSLAKVFGFGVLFGQGDLFGGARPVSIDASEPPRTAAA